MTVIPMDGALLQRRGDAAWIDYWQRLAERPFVGGTQIRAPRWDDRHRLALAEGDDAALLASGLKPRTERRVG